MTQAQKRVAEVEARIYELNGRLNPQSTTFIYGAGGSGNANEELEVRSQLNASESDLREARAALGRANQALQAKRQGRPPEELR